MFEDPVLELFPPVGNTGESFSPVVNEFRSLTLGIGVITSLAAVWIAQGHHSNGWPAFAWIIFTGLILAGVLFCCVAVLSSDTSLKKWIASSGTHEAEGIVAIFAAPVYWAGKLIRGPRRRR